MKSSTNQDKNKNKVISFFLNTRLAMIYLLFFVVEIRAFTVVVLNILAFSTLKSYFTYFATPLYNTPNIKCSISLITLFKI